MKYTMSKVINFIKYSERYVEDFVHILNEIVAKLGKSLLFSS